MTVKKRTKTYYGKDVTVVKNKTGEFLNDPNELQSVSITSVVNDEDDDFENDSILFKSDASFIKYFRGNGLELNKRLTPAEIALLIFLGDYICYEDCVLRKGGFARGRALTVKELADYRGMSYDSFRKIIASLKKKEVIGYHSTGNLETNTCTKIITVNPYIFCRGKKVSSWIYNFYKNTSWAILTKINFENEQ